MLLHVASHFLLASIHRDSVESNKKDKDIFYSLLFSLFYSTFSISFLCYLQCVFIAWRFPTNSSMTNYCALHLRVCKLSKLLPIFFLSRAFPLTSLSLIPHSHFISVLSFKAASLFLPCLLIFFFLGLFSDLHFAFRFSGHCSVLFSIVFCTVAPPLISILVPRRLLMFLFTYALLNSSIYPLSLIHLTLSLYTFVQFRAFLCFIAMPQIILSFIWLIEHFLVAWTCLSPPLIIWICSLSVELFNASNSIFY